MRGFTMVELIMVIVILGILAAVVGPRFFDRQVFDDRLFYEETLAAVRYAQKLAVSGGCKVQIGIDNTGYRVMRDANCATNGAPSYTANVRGPDGQSPYTGKRPASVTIQTNNFPVAFDSLGQPVVASNSSITIGQFVINVTAGTGLVR